MKRTLISGVTISTLLLSVHAIGDPYTPTAPKVPTPKTAPTKSTTTPAAQPTPAHVMQPGSQGDPSKAQERNSKKSNALNIESDWQARALKWFSSTEPKVRRKDMRRATKALKRPCSYCHSKDFRSYKENRLISQQMMAMSVEHGVQCIDCHAGKAEMTPMGKTAQHMWTLAQKKGVFCDHCHVPKTRFSQLTPAGKAFKAEAN